MFNLDIKIGGANTKFQESYALPILPEFVPTSTDLMKAGQWIVKQISTRTAAGLDVNETPFAPYSPDYQRRKRGPVDLRGPGAGPHMIDSVDYRVNASISGTTMASSLEVGIFGNTRNAIVARNVNEGGIRPTKSKLGNKSKGFASTPARYFLGLNPQELAQAQAIIIDSIKERNRANGQG